MSISCFIIACNEAKRIAAAIKSVLYISNEIIVIDSGSNDETVRIAQTLGARVVFHKWHGYVKQKVFGEKLCKHNWVLNIDADEELSIELQNEIQYIFSSDMQNKYRAYSIEFVIVHRNDTKTRLFAPSNRCIRLYDKRYVGFYEIIDTTTHDGILLNNNIKNKIYNFNSPAYHRSGISIEQLVAKANFYSTEQAKDLILVQNIPSNTRIVFEMLLHFFKAFFLRRYFIFGIDGVIDSIIFAFARFIRLAKAREIMKQSKDSIKY